MGILWEQALLPGTFLRRLNRFVVEADLDGQNVTAHMANSGRLEELLVPGRAVYVSAHGRPERKTGFDLVLVDLEGTLVSVDSRLPARLMARALSRGAWDFFKDCQLVRTEPPFLGGRLDLELECSRSKTGRRVFVETKSVTLVVAGGGCRQARFPDAPTPRGQRHIEDLATATTQGYGAAVVFVVQRPDADVFCPNWSQDPHLGRALVKAQRQGVDVLAYRCRVDLSGIVLDQRLPVDMTEGG